jgi:hypothetical protein
MMRKLIAIVVLLVAFWISFPVQAQSDLHLKSVTVDIWPEYDRPAVLVIYHLVLPSDAKFPVTLHLRIPAQAEVFAIAVNDPVKGLLNTPYDRIVQGSWAELTITSSLADVQVEYYDVLNKNGTSRHIVFNWAGDYATDDFSMVFQQPVGASDLAIVPALASTGVNQDGFTYYKSASQVLTAGQSITLTADYQKPTDDLSTTGLPVQPTQPISGTTPGRITMSALVPWLLAGAGVILLAIGTVGGLYLWKNGTRRGSVTRKHRSQPKPEIETEEIYCHHCGKRAQAGDVFCRTCGIRLQKEA